MKLSVSFILLLLCNHAAAQQPFDFFWSVNELGSGAVVNQDLAINVLKGESRTFYLYYTTDGFLQSELRIGGGLEIAHASPGTVRFDAGETFDFDVVTPVGDDFVSVGERWASSAGFGFAGAANVSDDFIDQFTFFTIAGHGISNDNRGPDFFDSGYDIDANAFLIGSIEITALETGLVDILTSVDEITSITDDGFSPIFPEFGGLTVNVVDQFNLENGVLTIFGTSDSDVIEVSTNGGSVSATVNDTKEHFAGVTRLAINAGSGDDQVTVNGPIRSDIFGEAGNDVLTGGSAPDLIDGGAGNDEINGRDGADILDGGSLILHGPNSNIISGGNGPDIILGGEGPDIINGGGGADQISALGGLDLVMGGNGNDRLGGGPGGDTLSGGSGNDTINGGAGCDNITGGNGADIIRGGPAQDTISGGQAADVINGGGGGDVINGGAGNDEIIGGQGSDVISGDGGNDVLDGQSGNDEIFGGSGNDNLTGGPGNDLLNGGPGNDTAVDKGEQGEIEIENS